MTVKELYRDRSYRVGFLSGAVVVWLTGLSYFVWQIPSTQRENLTPLGDLSLTLASLLLGVLVGLGVLALFTKRALQYITDSE